MNARHALAAAATCLFATHAAASRGIDPSMPIPIGTVTFSFVGQIGPFVWNDGAAEGVPYSAPADWLGGRVSGLIRMELDDATSRTETIDGRTYSGARWLEVQVRNPDGSWLTLPSDAVGGMQTGFAGYSDGSSDSGVRSPTSFNVQRASVAAGGYPLQSFSATLESFTAQITTNGPRTHPNEFTGLLVHADAADYTNRGVVRNFSAPGFGYQYGFQFSSITHMAPVPETSTVAMLLAGLGLVGAATARRRRRT